MTSGNHDLRNLLDSDFVMVNDELAYEYGIDDVEGNHFRKLSLPEASSRGGSMTMASVTLSAIRRVSRRAASL